MANKEISLTGAMIGALGGFAVDVAVTELTGQHLISGMLEIIGAAAGLWRLDRRLYAALADTLEQTRDGKDDDYRRVKQRIAELTQDLPELREILSNMVDAGIQAQKA